MQNGLEHRPAIAQLRVAEPGAGLADDQRLDDAALAAQARAKSRQRTERPFRARGAVGDHDIVGVDRVQPAVQEMQHRFRGSLVVRVRVEEGAADSGGLGHPAMIEMKRDLGAPGRWVLGIEHGGCGEGRGGGFRIAPAVQQMPAVQMVFRVLGSDRERVVDRRQGRVKPIEQHLDRRQNAQDALAAGVALGGVAHQVRSFVDIAGAQQEFGRMDRRAGVAGHQVEGPDGVHGCPTEIADRRERAAQMAVPLGPVPRPCEQAFVGCGGFAMAAAITEQPGAEMGGIAIVRSERKGSAADFERRVAAVVMKQRLGQLAIQSSISRAARFATSEELKTGIQLPGAERRRECIDIDQAWGLVSIEIQWG